MYMVPTKIRNPNSTKEFNYSWPRALDVDFISAHSANIFACTIVHSAVSVQSLIFK